MNLSDVLHTSLLPSRFASAAKRRRTETRTSLDVAAGSPIKSFAEKALIGCEAQSAGISVFSRADRGESTWLVAIGDLENYVGRRFPLRHSLCGVAAELEATQLFVKPHRYFKWIEQADIYISEALVTPLVDSDGIPFGTIWVMKHRGARSRFDSGDASLMDSLAAKAQRQLCPDPATEPVLC